MIDTGQIEQLRGANVHDRAGTLVGTAGDVYVDNSTGLPSWLAVTAGPAGGETLFVPLEGARFDGGDRVEVPYDAERIRSAPGVSSDGHLEPAEERELYRYYELADPYDVDTGPRGDAMITARKDLTTHTDEPG